MGVSRRLFGFFFLFQNDPKRKIWILLQIRNRSAKSNKFSMTSRERKDSVHQVHFEDGEDEKEGTESEIKVTSPSTNKIDVHLGFLKVIRTSQIKGYGQFQESRSAIFLSSYFLADLPPLRDSGASAGSYRSRRPGFRNSPEGHRTAKHQLQVTRRNPWLFPSKSYSFTCFEFQSDSERVLFPLLFSTGSSRLSRTLRTRSRWS